MPVGYLKFVGSFDVPNVMEQIIMFCFWLGSFAFGGCLVKGPFIIAMYAAIGLETTEEL